MVEFVVALTDPAACDSAIVGAKAANLARAARAGLPIVPGEVLTTAAPVQFGDSGEPSDVVLPESVESALIGIWHRLGRSGHVALAVRSSSTVEDLGASSMAGRFTSVVGVVTRDEFLRAASTVLASAVRAARDDGVPPRPMGVLVQPVIRPVAGGVLFGIDPVSGDRDHLVVEVSPLGAEAVVSGTVTAAQAVLTPSGRIVEADPEATGLLPRSVRHALASIARSTATRFDVPQDMEWVVDERGTVWLLQTRPVTAVGDLERASGPLLGQGPLAETFALPLRPLEIDLWLEPTRRGVVEVLELLGTASSRRIGRSPVVTVVDGWVVTDLALIGLASDRRGWRNYTPAPALRHLRAAWRVGALRSTLARTSRELCERTRSELAGVPALDTLESSELVSLVERTREVLRCLHAHQMLAAILLARETGPPLAAAAADALRTGRRRGLSDGEIVATAPVVLGLVPPSISRVALPAVADDSEGTPLARGTGADLTAREQLRLWIRLVQELSARACLELGRRHLGPHGIAPERVADLHWDELVGMAGGAQPPADLDRRERTDAARPLPAAFRLSASGAIVPQRLAGRGAVGGRGAGGGSGSGTVIHDANGPIAAGSVLVVTTLDPRLAPVIGRLNGLVAESGSVLSHLAILAREQRIPTVVGVTDARRRFPVGARVALDGGTGEIRRLPAEREEVR